MLHINIQSISDIITNSSSEVFCRISSQNDLLQIYDFLCDIFPRGDYELEPVVDLRIVDGDYINFLSKEEVEELDSKNLVIEIDLPYHMEENIGSFLKHGLDPTLKANFPNSDFNIKF